MFETRTTSCSALGRPEFVVSAAEGLEFGGEWIVSYLEAQVLNGAQFQEGETIQIGWSLVTLVRTSGGDLELWEPSFESMPVEWVRGVSKTIRHLTIQRELCEQVGCEPDFPSLREAGTILPVVEHSGGTRLVRHSDVGSGWVIFDSVSEPGLASLYEAAVRDPSVVPFVALPHGSEVSLSDDKWSVQVGERLVTSDSNDFLQELRASLMANLK